MKKKMFLALFFIKTNAFANNFSYNSANLTIGLQIPTYGKLDSVTSPFPAKILLLGAGVSFANKGFLMGGRMLQAKTYAEGTADGYSFENIIIGFLAGYGYSFNIIDIHIAMFFGLGNMQYVSVGTSTDAIINIKYLDFEPEMMLGFKLSSYFKLGIGFSYPYSIAYENTQLGGTFLTKSELSAYQIKAINLLLNLSFGSFR